jgi:putative transposase
VISRGTYHVISRGTERMPVFQADEDRHHFLDRLAEAQRRFRLCVFAYVLMDNHFHLIVCTPEANLSRAIQWLKVSYSMWFNAKYRRVGPLFQGRFKSVLIDSDESWLLELSFYVHLNPVRLKKLGLDKTGKAAEGTGREVPSPEMAAERLAVLRNYRWSSYPYYAGYRRSVPEWLDLDDILSRVKSRSEYRNQMEYRITHGVDPTFSEQVKNILALGGAEFMERVKSMGSVDRETSGKRLLRRMISWDDAVCVVEKVKKARWQEFSGVRGDWGRAAVCHIARKHAAMTLSEIGAVAGGMDYGAVSMMLKRFEKRMETDVRIRRHLAEAEQMLNIKT